MSEELRIKVQLAKVVKRKMAQEHIFTPFYQDDINLIDWFITKAEEAEKYEKSIKECVERMNEGGAGTRSFVYENLTRVMEGTQCTGK